MRENTYNIPHMQFMYAQVQGIDQINVGKKVQLFTITLVALMAQSIIIY